MLITILVQSWNWLESRKKKLQINFIEILAGCPDCMFEAQRSGLVMCFEIQSVMYIANIIIIKCLLEVFEFGKYVPVSAFYL